MTNEELKLTIESALKTNYQSALHLIANTLIADPTKQNLELIAPNLHVNNGNGTVTSNLLSALVDEYFKQYYDAGYCTRPNNMLSQPLPAFKYIKDLLIAVLECGVDTKNGSILSRAVGANDFDLTQLILSKNTAALNAYNFYSLMTNPHQEFMEVLIKYTNQDTLKTLALKCGSLIQTQLACEYNSLSSYKTELEGLIKHNLPSNDRGTSVDSFEMLINSTQQRITKIEHIQVLQNLAKADEVMKIFFGELTPVAEKAVAQVKHEEKVINLGDFKDLSSTQPQAESVPAQQVAEPVATEARDLFDGILSDFDHLASNIPASSSQQEAQVAGLDTAFTGLAEFFE